MFGLNWYLVCALENGIFISVSMEDAEKIISQSSLKKHVLPFLHVAIKYCHLFCRFYL